MNKCKSMYADDVDFSELPVEVPGYKAAVSHFNAMLQWLSGLCDSAPYTLLCLKLYLTVAVSITSCESNFPKPDLIKLYIKFTMEENRLSALSIQSTESDYVEKLSLMA